jgi:hypothetical protein
MGKDIKLIFYRLNLKEKMNTFFLKLISQDKTTREKMKVVDDREVELCRNIFYQNGKQKTSIELPDIINIQVRKVICHKTKRGIVIDELTFTSYRGQIGGLSHQCYTEEDIEEFMLSQGRTTNLIKRGIVAYYTIIGYEKKEEILPSVQPSIKKKKMRFISLLNFLQPRRKKR